MSPPDLVQRIVVRGVSSGLYHRGVRVGTHHPIIWADCGDEDVSETPLPPDVAMKLLCPSCLIPGILKP